MNSLVGRRMTLTWIEVVQWRKLYQRNQVRIQLCWKLIKTITYSKKKKHWANILWEYYLQAGNPLHSQEKHIKDQAIQEWLIWMRCRLSTKLLLKWWKVENMELGPQTKNHKKFFFLEETITKKVLVVRLTVWIEDRTCALIAKRMKKAMTLKEVSQDLNQDKSNRKLLNNRATFWSTLMSGKSWRTQKSCKKSWNKNSNWWKIFDLYINQSIQPNYPLTIKVQSLVTTLVWINSLIRKNSIKKSVRGSWMEYHRSINTPKLRII